MHPACVYASSLGTRKNQVSAACATRLGKLLSVPFPSYFPFSLFLYVCIVCIVFMLCNRRGHHLRSSKKGRTSSRHCFVMGTGAITGDSSSSSSSSSFSFISFILLHLHTRLHIFSISCPAVLDDLTEIFQILLQHYADFSRLQSAASVWRCASVRSHKCLDHQLASSGQHCAGHQVISTV